MSIYIYMPKAKIEKPKNTFEDLNKGELKKIIVYFNKESKVRDYAKSSLSELLKIVKNKFVLDGGLVYRREGEPFTINTAIAKRPAKELKGERLMEKLMSQLTIIHAQRTTLLKKLEGLETNPHGKTLTKTERKEREEEKTKIKNDIATLEANFRAKQKERKELKESL